MVSVPPETAVPSFLPSTTTGVPLTAGTAAPPVAAGAAPGVEPVVFGAVVAPLLLVPPPHAARIAATAVPATPPSIARRESRVPPKCVVPSSMLFLQTFSTQTHP